MWWREHLLNWRRSLRLVVVLAAAGLTAGCFEPLYKSHPSVGGEGVQDKFAAIEIPPIKAPKGTPTERVAVAMYNALSYDLHNGGNGAPPTYRLTVDVSSSQFVAVINPTSGRPDAAIEVVTASFQLTEIATGKTVVTDTTTMHVDYDIPGSQQRFAAQRARRDAEDRAVIVAAEAIRNRLASYFVAGT
jgi:LPS-assembly lipoprotein